MVPHCHQPRQKPLTCLFFAFLLSVRTLSFPSSQQFSTTFSSFLHLISQTTTTTRQETEVMEAGLLVSAIFLSWLLIPQHVFSCCRKFYSPFEFAPCLLLAAAFVPRSFVSSCPVPDGVFLIFKQNYSTLFLNFYSLLSLESVSSHICLYHAIQPIFIYKWCYIYKHEDECYYSSN